MLREWTAAWAAYIERHLADRAAPPSRRNPTEQSHMSAEADALYEQIKQSIALLRRHL
jgi:hypothetical protein